MPSGSLTQIVICRQGLRIAVGQAHGPQLLLGFDEIFSFPDPDEPGYCGPSRRRRKIGLIRSDFPVRVLSEPADQVWGERVAYVEDPDGNPVHVSGPVGD